jgi:hypothetical protein
MIVLPDHRAERLGHLGGFRLRLRLWRLLIKAFQKLM